MLRGLVSDRKQHQILIRAGLTKIHHIGNQRMQLRHPFEFLSASGQKWAFIVFFFLSIMVMAGLQVTGVHLRTEVAPRGIISFEFAGELALAQRMVESWGSKGQVYAGLNLGLDYLFLVVYACAIALGCVLVARGLLQRVAALSNLVHRFINTMTYLLTQDLVLSEQKQRITQ
jgi:hypothetical protein